MSRGSVRCRGVLCRGSYHALLRMREGRAVPVRLHMKSELTPAEIKFGRAPKRDRNVSYERDVIMVDGGAHSIRAVSPDDLTWTIG